MSEFYKHEGVDHPLIEAERDIQFKVYKEDSKKAVVGDVGKCLLARGIMRLRGVKFVNIGSGKEAYVGWIDHRSPTGITVEHYTLPAHAGRVRDNFEVRGAVKTQQLWLRLVTAGRTRAHRSKLGKERHQRIRAGTHIVKGRGKGNVTRIMRLGVRHRPRAVIVNGVVQMPEIAA